MEGRNDIYSGNEIADDVDLMERCPLTMTDTRLSLPPTYTDVVGSGTSAMVDLRDHHSDVSSASTEEASLPTKSSDLSTTPLEYRISDNPPIHLTIVFAFQQALLAFATQLVISLLVAQVVNGEHDPEFRGILLGSTMFMCGLTTFLMSLFGVRLPMLQGAAAEYIVPLLVLQDAKQDKCDVTTTTDTPLINSTGAYVDVASRLFSSNDSTDTLMSNITTLADGVIPRDYQAADYDKLQGMMGSLMIAGTVHFLMGATGLVGILLRFVGPITVVPTLLLVGFRMALMVADLISVHWGIGIMTAASAVILSLYLGRWKMPLPFWSRSKGFHIIRSTLHQTAGILIALLSGWALCGILTQYGAFSDDPKAPDYYARTDFMPGVIQNARWVYLPYPGQFGMPSFSARAMIGFLIATLLSILDSIGDYYACAMACNVPPPPAHAVNRGIAVEGLCSFLSGTLGCGHATGTYGGNIGAIRITKRVESLNVGGNRSTRRKPARSDR
ncbi:solute carrier family 23 member 2-like [Mizuhopecten yessoensis]|uniref:solute carrier family 23 member 2-like n=1 Tax=Mizuhopecten yessoensis TaxID=6573 RepID=UPI000B45752F|nr:solute carrier family 23 member 2-like [Mizuhopecten yessoensis]